MAKTKDELESDIHDAIWDSIYAEGGEVGGGDKAAEKCVDIAIEFAKQQSIAFVKFIVDGSYDNVVGDYDGIVSFAQTPEQLYNIFEQLNTK